MSEEQPSILVIDDTPGNLSLLNQLLREHYRVRLANSGPRGLELAAFCQEKLASAEQQVKVLEGEVLKKFAEAAGADDDE